MAYLLGIIITLVSGTFLYIRLCSDCTSTKPSTILIGVVPYKLPETTLGSDLYQNNDFSLPEHKDEKELEVYETEDLIKNNNAELKNSGRNQVPLMASKAIDKVTLEN